jgi:hypothetical protein
MMFSCCSFTEISHLSNEIRVMQKKNSFSIIKQLMPALKVNIIIVHHWDVVFLRAKALEKTTTLG